MKIAFNLIILVLLLPLNAIAQVDIEKAYNKVVANKITLVKTIDYLSRAEMIIADFVDSLKKEGVDTLGVYSVAYIGSYTFDTCSYSYESPKDIYIQWKMNGNYYHRELASRCNITVQKINDSKILSFYHQNKTLIEKSQIVAAFTSVGKDEFSFISVSHEASYTLFLQIKEKEYYTFFDETSLMKFDDALFYKKNQESIINKWRIEIEKQIEELAN
jgi:hypothetical protein